MAKQKTQPRVVIVVGDTHCGSTSGLLPPGLLDHEGREMMLSKAQRWLWDCWRRGRDWAMERIGGDDYAVVMNGDAIEGNHHRTTQIISPETSDHVNAAHHAMSIFTNDASEVFIVRGTECHVGNKETSLGAQLGAVKNPDTGHPSFDHLYLKVADTLCSFNHHINATSRPYLEASQFSIHMTVEKIECVRAGHEPPRVICRQHRHRFGKFDNGHSLLAIGGCWQFLTRHGHRVVPGAKCFPTVYMLDWRDRKDGDLPDVPYLQMQPPAPTVVSL